MKSLAELLDVQAVRIGHDNPWATRNPLDEARDLYRMVRCGSCSLEEIRGSIAVPKPIEEALLAYAEGFPNDGQPVYSVLLFRESVAKEFERLIENDRSFAEPPQVSIGNEICREPVN
jgi:hypothetical protein